MTNVTALHFKHFDTWVNCERDFCSYIYIYIKQIDIILNKLYGFTETRNVL